MRHLIRFILARIAWYIQEISYAPSDLRQWNRRRKTDRVLGKKYKAICKRAGIKCIRFQDLTAQYPRRTTSTYNCWNHSDVLLGCVEWKGRYIFEPNQAERLVFDAACLADISHFIKQLMEARK